ncbi:hypothetical protein [Nocardia sp. NBC_00511]|uniref:hypothetical protein n=1 Tax=Nocardia sp. NBC_00511 TaxID=2903591 RepID=UPI002F911A3B
MGDKLMATSVSGSIGAGLPAVELVEWLCSSSVPTFLGVFRLVRMKLSGTGVVTGPKRALIFISVGCGIQHHTARLLVVAWHILLMQ